MHRWRAWQDETWWLGGCINWMEKCGKESEIWFSKDTVDQEIKGKQLHYKSVVGDLSPSNYLRIKFMTQTVTLKHSLRVLNKCSQITKHYQHLPGRNFCWHDPNGQVHCEAILAMAIAPTNDGSSYLVGKLIKVGSLHRLIDGTLIKKIDLLYGWFIFGEANFSLLLAGMQKGISQNSDTKSSMMKTSSLPVTKSL